MAVELRPDHDTAPSDHHDVCALGMELRPRHHHGPTDYHDRPHDNIGPANHNRTADHPTEHVLLVEDLVLTTFAARPGKFACN
ncbi:hypothetical protein [Nocardia sp. CDC160]|uniref:hypothetical protein n=1 Tax=Nocardia sp. CDC160 TaxID=3112166 RepID=UPI002DC060EE|nr:hypothetical protein [Nocardia sp. CDC160]MEC3916342.1 hypothetical protein [Nocardia sp. CDC160]